MSNEAINFIRVHVNGQPQITAMATTLAEILRQLGIALPHLAVALNQTVIPRSQYGEIVLQNGDTVEILRAVAGG